MTDRTPTKATAVGPGGTPGGAGALGRPRHLAHAPPRALRPHRHTRRSCSCRSRQGPPPPPLCRPLLQPPATNHPLVNSGLVKVNTLNAALEWCRSSLHQKRAQQQRFEIRVGWHAHRGSLCAQRTVVAATASAKAFWWGLVAPPPAPPTALAVERAVPSCSPGLLTWTC